MDINQKAICRLVYKPYNRNAQRKNDCRYCKGTYFCKGRFCHCRMGNFKFCYGAARNHHSACIHSNHCVCTDEGKSCTAKVRHQRVRINFIIKLRESVMLSLSSFILFYVLLKEICHFFNNNRRRTRIGIQHSKTVRQSFAVIFKLPVL